jgi:hypothetical protein
LFVQQEEVRPTSKVYRFEEDHGTMTDSLKNTKFITIQMQHGRGSATQGIVTQGNAVVKNRDGGFPTSTSMSITGEVARMTRPI